MAGQPTNLYDWIAVQNIDDELFTFHVDGSPYQIAPDEVRYFPRFMAVIAVKHLVTKILNKRDPEGKKTKNQTQREALASQIVLEEKPMAMPVKRSQDEINREMVAKMNESSDLDAVLKRRRGQLKSVEAASQPVDELGNPIPDRLIPPPSVVPPEVEVDDDTIVTNKKTAKSKKPSKVTPTETNEDGASKLPPAITDADAPETTAFKVPDRQTLLDYAKNELKLNMDDKKTVEEFEKLSDEDLAIEIGYPLDEE